MKQNFQLVQFGQSWSSTNPGLKPNPSLCIYFNKASQKKTPIDPDKISEEIFPHFSCWKITLNFKGC
jgi:hypothetical protein